MKFTVATILAIVCALCVVKHVECARILAIIPVPSYSHQLPFRRLLLDLNKRGHEVVFVAPNSIATLNRTNFRQIDIGECYKVVKNIGFMKSRFNHVSWMQLLENSLWDIGVDITECTVNQTEVKALYSPNSGEKFDVVMAEVYFLPAIYAFAHRFNAPLIGLCSLGISSINEHVLGGLVLPSHESTWEMETRTGPNLSFWKRMQNFLIMAKSLYIGYNKLIPAHQRLAEKYFGANVPPLMDILKNISVVFVNQASMMTPARPSLTNIIPFTSFHIDEVLKPLPQDLKRFIESDSEGFIYFSLGTNAKSSELPKEIQQVFLDVFAELPYKIVWKFEKELPEKSDNVFVSSWFPQQSVLAHPNIKLFMTQGGLQSTEEAVHFTIPLLGFPVLADQDYQMTRMEALGVAKFLDIRTVKKDELKNTILEIITNKEYKENMIDLKESINDNPYDLVNNLVWWTEYVLRRKGAPHLRSSLTKQPWYQRCDMDVVVFLALMIFTVVWYSINVISKLLMYCYMRRQIFTAKQKQKIC